MDQGRPETASVNVETQRHCVTLKYRSRSHGADWSDIEQRIAIAWTPCRSTANGHGLSLRQVKRRFLWSEGDQALCRWPLVRVSPLL